MRVYDYMALISIWHVCLYGTGVYMAQVSSILHEVLS